MQLQVPLDKYCLTEHNYIIEAQRGMGNTTLLLRLAYEIENDADINQKVSVADLIMGISIDNESEEDAYSNVEEPEEVVSEDANDDTDGPSDSDSGGEKKVQEQPS